MSGFEVAGIVLAVLPLCISAIEDYKEGLEPLKAFVQWNNQLATLIRALRAQHVHYEMNLKAILMPITSDHEVTSLMSDGYGEMWNGEIGKRLEDRLDLAYKSYQSTVEDCQRIMTAIAKGLDVERNGKADRGDLEAILDANRPHNNKYEFRKRVKFGLKIKDMKRLLRELDENNKTLARFQEKTDTLAPYKKPNKNHFTSLNRIRGHAKDLHAAIISRGRGCKFHKMHNLKLGLDKRIAPTRAEAKRAFWKPQDIDFRILFSTESPTRALQELRIHVLEEDDIHRHHKNHHHDHNMYGRPPKVHIQEPATTEKVHTHPVLLPASFDYRTLEVIDDLCATAHILQVDGHCHGLCLDADGNLRGVFPVKQDRTHDDHKIVTLAELLSSPKVPGSLPRRLSRRERYVLAVELTSSLLQLHATPWLDEFWSKRDILFIESNGSTLTSQPYVSHTIGDRWPSGDHKIPPKNKIAHASPSLLALGIILLELYLNQTLEAATGHESPYDVEKNGNEMLCAAWQWADSVGDEFSLPYWQAAQHCIKCMFEPMPRVSSLHDAEFRQAVCEKVLAPLLEELWTFTEGPSFGKHF
jgi:hypothetical protein